ncbi:MAG: cellulase family glycosylhydrolase [Reinekea sp.]
MEFSFKKIGLSASIAMITLGLSACNISVGNGGGSQGGSNTPDSSDTSSDDQASEREDEYPVVDPITIGDSIPGRFRVNQNGQITENGKKFAPQCGNWFGLEGQQEPKGAPNNADGAPMELYMGNMWWNNTGRTIDSDMKMLKAKGINMVRLPIAPQTLDPMNDQGTGDASQKQGGALKNHPSVQQSNALEGLKDFLRTADANDIKVLIDIHSCSNYVGWRSGRLDAAPPWEDAERDDYHFKREEWSCNAGDAGKTVTLDNGQVVAMNVQAYDKNKWLTDLKTIAQLPKDLGIDNVIGIDIFNEPWDYSWSEWSTLAEEAYQNIASVNDDLLIFVEGIGSKTADGTKVEYGPSKELNPNWGENLYGFAQDPLDIPKDRLVLAPHTYGPSVSLQPQFFDQSRAECVVEAGDEDVAAENDCNIVIDSAQLRKGWHEHFGYLKDNGYAVLVGEFGGNMDWPRQKVNQSVKNKWSHITGNVDEQWQNKLVNYLVDNEIPACYWSINPESADTMGWISTPWDPITADDKWGSWGSTNDTSTNIFDERKTQLLNKLWNN